jgi:hypothetical protein
MGSKKYFTQLLNAHGLTMLGGQEYIKSSHWYLSLVISRMKLILKS